jgi:hypothetical protein
MGYQVPRVSGDIGQDAFQDMQRLSRASRLYIGLPRLAQVYGFMADHGFRFVSFYRFYYQHAEPLGRMRYSLIPTMEIERSQTRRDL